MGAWSRLDESLCRGVTRWLCGLMSDDFGHLLQVSAASIASFTSA